jgi:hypothetical protein
MQETLPQLQPRHDAERSQHLIAFTEAACRALARMDPIRAAQMLPAVFEHLSPLLSSSSDAARRSAADALRGIMSSCITPDVVGSSVTEAVVSRTPAPLAKAVAVLADLLQPIYHDAWPVALPVVGDMLLALGPRGAPLAKLLLQPLAALCRYACHEPVACLVILHLSLFLGLHRQQILQCLQRSASIALMEWHVLHELVCDKSPCTLLWRCDA